MENSSETANNSGTASELWDTTDSEDDAIDSSADKSNGAHYVQKKGKDSKSSSESGDLSDIKDAEVDSYLNNAEQKNYKKMIWEMMNQKYLDDQAAKKKMAASNASEPKAKQKQKTAKDVKKDQSTAKPTLAKKRPSSRLNHIALQNLFEEEPVPDRNKKRARTESETTGGPADDLELGDEDEADEQNEHEYNSRYPHYNDQDEDYYFDDDEEFF